MLLSTQIVDRNAYSRAGRTPLHLAAELGLLVAHLLHVHDHNVAYAGLPLYCAFLVIFGADTQLQDGEGVNEVIIYR